MTARIRTGFSFKTAVGHLPDVMKRIQAIGLSAAPITDRLSTFGFNRWTKIAKAAGLKPIYGVEIPVVPELGAKKPTTDAWTFLARDALRPLNDLISLATGNPGREPTLLMAQALKAPGVFKIAGERFLIDALPFEPDETFFFGLSPSVSKGLLRRVTDHGFKLIAMSDNFFPCEEDQEFYRVALGRMRAGTQTYPQHILSAEEWRLALEFTASPSQMDEAVNNREKVFAACNAKMKLAKLLVPKKEKTLLAMCTEGAKRKGVNLKDNVYKERLKRELALIKEKDFEDYFYILSDMIKWAKQRMIVGPARGSSCGSLVCYLLDITEIDPIPYDLIFERFIDINRKDLPDIDVDFSDTKRFMVFEYAEERYGKERVARLGTVGTFQPRAAINQAGKSLRIPSWRTNKVMDSLIERSSGDSRAMMALEDTLNETEAGRLLLTEHPEIKIATRMEGHPSNPGQHAAGVLITDDPIAEYVAVDSRTNGSMCDKKDSEDLNLLKIDALGLTQLSIFERTLELIGEKPISGWLEKLPLNDPQAFAVLNEKKFSGIFQFTGTSLRSLCSQITVDGLEDIIAMTALARPGPLGSGGTSSWIRRKRGEEKVTTAHPMLTELTKETFGVVIYQETVMRIVREMGKMSWEDTSAIRKAMSGRLGDEFFERYWEKFLKGAFENGVEEGIARNIWKQINTFGSWSFNRCLAGSTKIRLSRTKGDSNKTIAQLYKKYEKNKSVWIKQRKSTPWLISKNEKGVGKPQKAVRIIKNGKKECIRLTFDDRSSVVCTPDHKFLINDKWKPCGKASIGDSFFSFKGHKTPYKAKSAKGKGHAAGKKWNVGAGNVRTKSHNVSFTTGVSAHFDEFKANHKGKDCESCGLIFPRMEAHHLDFNEGRTDPKALAWLCVSCHKKAHYGHGRNKLWSHGKQPAQKTLVKIEAVGMKETYDIEMPTHHNFMLSNGLLTHNSHAVAYGIVSYWSCWLKAHHPIQFAAATLDAEKTPEKQIALLRELAVEGVRYIPVDLDHSTERWAIAEKDGKKFLTGPLTAIKGIGPATVREILDARKKGEPIRPTILKRIENAKTDIDSLFPIYDRIKELHPDLSAINIFSQPTPIVKVQPGMKGEVMIFGMVKKIAPRDENESINVQKRGYAFKGPTDSLNLFFTDDTEEIFAKVDRFSFKKLGPKIINEGRAGKSLYAVKGTVPNDFRMIKITAIRYLGEM